MKLGIIFVMQFFASSLWANECTWEKQVDILALNMYHEARGEGIDGMQMVGEVTLNRVQSSKFPDNICEVVFQDYQFEWVKVLDSHKPKETEYWTYALKLAVDLVNGDLKFFDNGATHFLNPNKIDNLPKWAREYQVVGKIGNHVFFKEG